MNYKKLFKRETKVIAYVVIALTLIVIGTSYALFLQVNNNRDNQVVTAGSLVIEYAKGNTVNVADSKNNCLTPQSDATGSSTGGCNFMLSITNKGTLPMQYDLLIYNNTAEAPSGAQFVDHSVIKHSLNKQYSKEGAKSGTVTSAKALSTLGTKDGKRILETSTINVGETITFSLNIWISENAPVDIIGKYVYLKLDVVGNVDREEVFTFETSRNEFSVPYTGEYQLEVWGAQGGGANNSIGGFGGYSSGRIKLNANQKLFIYVGGQGQRYAGGYNGGGTGAACGGQWAYGGGGATHIALVDGLLNSLESNKDKILIVAAGGGANGGSSSNATGGSGGGIEGSAGYNTVSPHTGHHGTGATQTAGGSNTYPASCGIGSFGKGSDFCDDAYGGAGGGGGFYGGGGSSRGHGGAGGGSGYIGNTNLFSKAMYCYNCTESIDDNTKTISTTNVSETPMSKYAKQGNGYAKITFIRET